MKSYLCRSTCCGAVTKQGLRYPRRSPKPRHGSRGPISLWKQLRSRENRADGSRSSTESSTGWYNKGLWRILNATGERSSAKWYKNEERRSPRRGLGARRTQPDCFSAHSKLTGDVTEAQLDSRFTAGFKPPSIHQSHYSINPFLSRA